MSLLLPYGKQTDTDKILRAIAGVHEHVDTVAEQVSTLTHMVGGPSGQVSSIETDITTIKGDVRNVHTRIDVVEELANKKVSHTEFNGRLQPIEEKLGVPSPK